MLAPDLTPVHHCRHDQRAGRARPRPLGGNKSFAKAAAHAAEAKEAKAEAE